MVTLVLDHQIGTLDNYNIKVNIVIANLVTRHSGNARLQYNFIIDRLVVIARFKLEDAILEAGVASVDWKRPPGPVLDEVYILKWNMTINKSFQVYC